MPWPLFPASGLPLRPPGMLRASKPTPSAARPLPRPRAAFRPQAGPSPRILAVLRDAGTYFTGQLAGSWAPGYLSGRGISEATARDWHIGYAPAGWTALTVHLRSLGHNDREIQAAGLGKPSSRGTLIDFDASDVLTVVANAVTLGTCPPKGQEPAPRDTRERDRPAP